jgi:hypothetical protein
MASRMSSPSVSFTLALSVTMASSYLAHKHSTAQHGRAHSLCCSLHFGPSSTSTVAQGQCSARLLTCSKPLSCAWVPPPAAGHQPPPHAAVGHRSCNRSTTCNFACVRVLLLLPQHETATAICSTRTTLHGTGQSLACPAAGSQRPTF